MPEHIHKQASATKVEKTLSATSAHDESIAMVQSQPQDHPPFLEAVVAQTTDAMIAVDEHFHILDFNSAASTSLGWSRPSVLGHNCSKLLHCQNLNHTTLCGTSSCPLVRVLQLQKPLPHEDLILGDCCETSTSITPLATEQHNQYVVFTARDLSSLKVANQVRANFVSMVSHELRTPLNSVHGFIDLILQGHMGELTEEQARYLGYSQEGVQQLIAIVEDILFMTRSDVGQFEIKQQKVNVRVLAIQVVSSMEPLARKAGVVLEKDIPTPSPLLYADPQRIKQVLNNLVTNAIKFTPPEGIVTIKAYPYNADFVLISVTDTGYGIPHEDCQHVFERFYQSNHNQQSRMGGYGLGLSIARLIVEQHGGFIDFDTVVGAGTTFYFTIPTFKDQPA